MYWHQFVCCCCFFVFFLAHLVATCPQCWEISLTMVQKPSFLFCSTSSPTVQRSWPPPVCLRSVSLYGYDVFNKCCWFRNSFSGFIYSLYSHCWICVRSSYLFSFTAPSLQHTHVPRLIPLITSNCTSKSVAVRRWGHNRSSLNLWYPQWCFFCGDETDGNISSSGAVMTSWTFCCRNGRHTL